MPPIPEAATSGTRMTRELGRTKETSRIFRVSVFLIAFTSRCFCKFVTMQKTFVGPQLRQLRRLHGETQAQMAQRLGISASYVNLLENNQRCLSVRCSCRITEEYGVDWRDLVTDKSDNLRPRPPRRHARSRLRRRIARPPGTPRRRRPRAPHRRPLPPALPEHRTMADRSTACTRPRPIDDLLSVTPETIIHDFFRDHANHFDPLERAAEKPRASASLANRRRHVRRCSSATSASNMASPPAPSV